MADPFGHESERLELANLDYFLDQLARAVERGEVPPKSYDTLAPRYLARRAELVAILTGVNERAAAAAAEAREAAAWGDAHGRADAAQAAAAGLDADDAYDDAFELEWARNARRDAEAAARAARRGPLGPTARPAYQAPYTPRPVTPRPERKPVEWTTALLFLGAFLLIVATAIFAFWAWDRVGPVVKLAGLGAVTLGFYAGGWYVRTKMQLKTGGSALVVVASAMLLFWWWILIDGWQLQPIPAWSVALFVTSIIYWVSEVALGDGYYGVAGAAAQVGWWWLMADGLHLHTVFRVAGIAAIALVWQLVAERARQSEYVGSLARMLEWAAPAAEVLTALGLLGTLITLGEPTSFNQTTAAAVTAVAGAVVLGRTRHVSDDARHWLAAFLQIPLFVAIVMGGKPSWLGVALLAVITALYTVWALYRGGTAYAICAFVAEVLTVGSVVELLHTGPHARAAVFAALAVTWVAAGDLAQMLGHSEAGERTWRGARELATSAWIAGAALLVFACAETVTAGAGVPLSGVHTPAADAQLAAIVLAAWATASLVRRRALFAGGAVLWSFYALAALIAWGVPGWHSAMYALLLLALAGVWLAIRVPLERFYRLPEEATGWAMRAFGGAIVVGGLIAEAYFFNTWYTWQAVALAVAAVAFYAADTFVAGPPITSAAAVGFALLAANLAARTHGAFAGENALAIGAVAAVVGVAAAYARDRDPERATTASLAAALGVVVFAPAALSAHWAVVAAFVLWAVSIAGAGWAWRRDEVAFAAGLAIFGAVATGLATAHATWQTTLIAFALGAVALGAATFVPGIGPGAAHERLGRALAVGPAAALAALIVASYFSGWLDASWLDLPREGTAIALLVLGAYVMTQAALWRVEWAQYIGAGIILLGVLQQFRVWALDPVEYYSTAIGIYAIAMGYLAAFHHPEHGVPVGADAAAVLVALGVPVVQTISTNGQEGFTHLAWAVALSVAFVAAGILGRVRWYLFGGIVAMVVASAWKTIIYLAGLWWVIFGLLGLAAILIAITWERQRTLFADFAKRTESWR